MSLNIPLRVRNLVNRHDTSDPYRIAKELNCSVYFLVNGQRILETNTAAQDNRNQQESP